MKRLSVEWIYLSTILIFSILGMKALFHPGLFTAHDIWHQVVRLYYYSQAINDGQILPLWISQLASGFGYPLFFFSYQLPWIISVPFLAIGLDIPTTIKVLFFLAYLSSGIAMYCFVRNLIKNRLAALLSAILYLWLPYHFLIIFVGASMGIAFVFTFIPLIFWGIHLIKECSKAGIPLLAIGFTGVVLSHIMHLVFLFPIIFIFLLWSFINSKEKVNFLSNIAFGLILGITISAFYLIPAMYYSQFTRIHQETGFYGLYQRNFIKFSQLIYSKWGYGPIINNAKNGESSFQLGMAQWISIIILLFIIILKKLPKEYQGLATSLLLSFIISIFLMMDLSKPFWEFITKIAIVDFPFRFLLSATFIASVCAGVVLAATSRKYQTIIFIFFVITAIYTNRNHLNVNQYTDFPISNYLNLETEKTTNTFNEYLPIKADPKLLDKPWNEAKGDNLVISNLKHRTNFLSFDVSADTEETISVGQFYFPGQTLYVDEKIKDFSIDIEGKISFVVPQGMHNITVRYQESYLIRFSKFLTMFGLVIFFLLLRNIKLSRKHAISN